jgi:quinol monooxygenase YgiN
MDTNRRNFIKKTVSTALFVSVLPLSSTLISCNQTPRIMNKQTLKVVAIAETTAEKAEELKKVCMGLIEPTRKETGCITYELFQDNKNVGIFTFVEEWESQQHLDVHLKTPHLVAAAEAFGRICTKDLIILMLNKLA